MSALLVKLADLNHYLFDELCDERTKHFWPSAGVLATILISYLYFCLKLGPAWMKDRKPYDLTTVIFYYNIFQIIASTYLTYEAGKTVLFESNLTCQPILLEDTPFTRKVNNLTWLYTTLKVVELLDTVFFVLRKKWRQISSLHLYHHFMMPITSFIGLKYYPNGHNTMIGFLNCFVHILMYTYYLLASMGPQYEKYLWWKKHVTSIQIIQFVLVLIHNIIPLVTGCNYPKWINVSLSLSSIHFIYMFGSFYYKTYIKTLSKSTLNNKKIEKSE